ncbi:MAG: hypothetical protein ACLUS6_05565 [Dysosmobacter sp.]
MDVKTVSSMLGHYDAGFTLRTYTHATRQKQRRGSTNDGQLHGAGHVSRKKPKIPERRQKPPLRYSLSLSTHFVVWVTVWVRRLTHILTHT